MNADDVLDAERIDENQTEEKVQSSKSGLPSLSHNCFPKKIIFREHARPVKH